MRQSGAVALLTMAIVGLGCSGRAKPSAASAGAQNDVWEISLTTKSHTHVHGASSSANEEKLNDDDIAYTLVLDERVHGTVDGNNIDLGGDDGTLAGTPTSSGAATERLHNRHAVMRDLQEQWSTRDGTIDPPPTGGGAHFAWDGSAHQGIFEAAAHYTGTQSSREHVIDVGNKIDRTDTSSDKWIQSALFGGDAKHPVTVKQTKTGFTVDWAWTDSTRDPGGATKEIQQSGHADIHQ